MVLGFDTLSSQAIRCILIIEPNAEVQANQRIVKNYGAIDKMESMETFKQVRQAALGLHSALETHWSCHTHDRHEVSICSAKCLSDQYLSFETVLAGYKSGETKNLICMEVEAGDQLDDVATGANSSSLKAFRNTKAMQLDPTSVSPAEPELRQGSPTVELSCLEPIRDIATGPTKVQDLCLHFQQQCEEMRSGKQLLGYYSEMTMQRSFSLGPGRRALGNPRSLAELVKSGNPLPSLSRIERATIAASLAKSVLQFHSTPWLPELWDSGNIMFFQKDPEATDTLASPHLNINIRLENDLANDQGFERGDLPPALTVENDFIRNELLFRLGVVLLETGLAWPWDSLRQEMVENKKVQEGTSLCNIADQLAQTDLRSHMGPDYSTAVQMCLWCDFGLGINDFNSEKLQAVFHREVVQRLQNLRSCLADFRQRGVI